MRVGIICKYIFDIFDYVDGDDDRVVHEVRKLIETDSNDLIIQELRDLVSRYFDIEGVIIIAKRDYCNIE